MLLNSGRSAYRSADRELIGGGHAAAVRALLGFCPASGATPLLALPDLAAALGVAHVAIKAEWSRMGLTSFKALGGGYAVARLIQARASAALGRPATPEELRSPRVQAIARAITVACASAGNHGLSVAAAARVFGAQAVVYLSLGVPERFAAALRAKGATVVREGASYEGSMAAATAAAARHGWDLVSDSSWPGYTQVPLDVMRGYTPLIEEAAEALEMTGGPASHVFVQAGVGGLAAAAAGLLRDRWGEDFTFVVVEPDGAPCLLESARAGRPVRITGAPTSLGRLDCKEPSLLALHLLDHLADGFVTVSDAAAEAAASRLATLGAPVSPCGATGAAGLIAACADPAWRRALALDPRARVLLIGTEAAETLTPGDMP
ncbi:MAG TPA: diaminopropionate ammonia-lyase [Aliidongia sp.]|uniref:diaminopropionate ammonia-lyase n=1 Tax=Aliidongia sp. TaxID=1914230 RepID=UPI002DDD1D3B|nr:diaminopropionate ammonia-lyase [Aliidongia sp.]HEV2675937.1 diaminopropionate ammonia-lyase [Aliidongia sp.]